MKKLLNTVYVTTENVSLHKDGENIVAEVERVEKARVPLHMIGSVIAFGPIYVSPAILAVTAQKGISFVFLSRYGRFEARVEGPVSGNVLLRKAQYKLSDTPELVIRSIIIGKILNQRSVLLRGLRDYSGDFVLSQKNALETAVKRLAHIARQVEILEHDVAQMRGREGEAANIYFSVFNHLIRSPDEGMKWTQRSRRPPLDPINALLSFIYTLLTHECRSACEAVGLDPAVGFLHRDRPGRPSLALDLMEEFRPVLADRLVLSLINRRQLRERDFKKQEGGAVIMSEDARKTVLSVWQDRKKEERIHPFIQEKVPYGLLPFLQAQLLSRYLRNDMDAYPPWFWK